MRNDIFIQCSISRLSRSLLPSSLFSVRRHSLKLMSKTAAADSNRVNGNEGGSEEKTTRVLQPHRMLAIWKQRLSDLLNCNGMKLAHISAPPTIIIQFHFGRAGRSEENKTIGQWACRLASTMKIAIKDNVLAADDVAKSQF